MPPAPVTRSGRRLAWLHAPWWSQAACSAGGRAQARFRPRARESGDETAMTSTPGTDQARAADVLVIFGITGDLAKVMTFRSLYRLEKRGLLTCPIVGVAVDDWTVDQLIERARESIQG